jgi:hypothetical protein
MTERLYAFFITDDSARWKAILRSWGVGTLASVIVVLAHGPTSVIAGVSILTSVVSLVAFLAVYLVAPTDVRDAERDRTRRAFIDYAYGGLTVAMCAAIERIIATPQAVHAASRVILRDLLEDNPGSMVDLLALQARARRLLEDRKITGSARKQTMSDYAIIKAALAYSGAKSKGAPIQSGVAPPHQRATFSYPPGVGPMFRNPCGVIFRDLNFISTTPGSILITTDRLVTDFGCHTIFKDATIQGFTQKLDDIVWIDVVFEKCTLVYSGGPLTLVNIVIRDCDVRTQADVPEALRDALISGPGPITVASDAA